MEPRTRASRQREVVLEAVRSSMDHPTAEWVFRRARRRLPRISQGTVSRNLEQLVGEGLVHEIHVGGHVARFDANTGRHYHIRCLGCRRVSELPMSVTSTLEEEAARATSYQVLGHAVEIYGLCPACQDVVKDKNDSH